MATYKVIQDIEAEDKLLGPLTLRQFIYAIIVVVSGFMAFRLASVKIFLALPFLPIMIFFGMLAAPFGHDQPSEIWLLAKVRFFLKPRRRIWDQSGTKQLVSVTAPKRIEKNLTNNLSQGEVKSRLQALAETIDSRGWAVKNINVNMFSEPSYVTADGTSDRLVAPTSLPQDVPSFDVQATDDMLDEQSNPTAQNLSQMIAASTASLKTQAIKKMKRPPAATDESKPDYWFLNEPLPGSTTPPDPGLATFVGSEVVKPGATAAPSPAVDTSLPAPEEQALLDKIRAEEEQAKATPMVAHAKVLQSQPDPAAQDDESTSPFSVAAPEPPAPSAPQDNNDDKTLTATPKTAIIELANNDDLSVATLQRQAEKASRKRGQLPEDEVVISLR